MDTHTIIDIALADDHNMVRQGIRALLEREDDFRVVGEAADGNEAVQMVERTNPQVVLVDVMMPRMSGIEVIAQLQQRGSETKSLVLSTHMNESYVIQALRYGAAGYVLKEEHAAQLIHAVRQVSSGARYLSPAISERAIQVYLQNSATKASSDVDRLTLREQEILQQVAEGRTNGEIADRLSISVRTVETHRSNLMRKLGLHTKTELIRYSVQQGFEPAATRLPE